MKTQNMIPGSLLIAMLIIFSWFFSLWFFLKMELSAILVPVMILWQTFCYTGLFITAHDAMHGVIYPSDRKLNNATGAIAVFLYALFSFQNLLSKHWDHHKYPASSGDPDYHDGIHRTFWAWYFRFMRNYIQWKQIIGMAIVFNIFLHIFHIPIRNMLLFWVFPSLLSTIQLFYFGTFLPHRDSGKPFADRHRARSVYLPVFLSFVTCYHFGGFHWEHHSYPNTAWYNLPGHKAN